MTERLDLFPAAPLLLRLPDESLFSLVSRHHFLWGNSVASTTSRQFFSHARRAAHHDFLNWLQSFVERTGAVYGDVRHVAINLTLLKFYQPFLSQEEVSNAVEYLSHGRIALLRLRLGIHTSGFRANHPLKACVGCMQEDMHSCGWTYWHMKHQYPGVWICTKHGMPLQQSKSIGVGRFHWVLPRLDDLHDCIANAGLSATHHLEVFAGFADLVEAAVSEGTRSKLEVDRFHERYRAEFMNRGWVSEGGQLRLKAISASFVDHLRFFPALDELAGFPRTVQQASPQLSRLLSSPQNKTHPLRHLVMIHWLFGTWEQFSRFQPVRRVASTVEQAQSRSDEVVDIRKEELNLLLRNKNVSLRAAASRIGVDAQTALAWAATMGFAIHRRPKVLHPDVREQVIRRLRTGADKSVVASEAGVTVQTIARLLLAEVGLHRTWMDVRHERARGRARKIWTKLLKTSGGVGVKWMRAMEPAVYSWLYRNDRSWLNEHKPCQSPQRRQNAASVDWKARDELLCVAVEKACLTLLSEHGERLKHANQLYPLIPQLHSKRRQLDKLPLTRRAIERALVARPPGAGDLFN